MILTPIMTDFLFSKQCCWRHRCLGYDNVSLGKQMMMMMMTTITMTMNRKRKKMNKKKKMIFFSLLSKPLNTHTGITEHYKSLAWAHAGSPITLQLYTYTVQTNKFIHQATCLQVVWCRTRFSPTGRGHGSVTTGRGRSARGGDGGGGEHHSHCSSRASTKVPVSTWPHRQRHCPKPIQGSGRLTNTTPNW